MHFCEVSLPVIYHVMCTTADESSAVHQEGVSHKVVRMIKPSIAGRLFFCSAALLPETDVLQTHW